MGIGRFRADADLLGLGAFDCCLLLCLSLSRQPWRRLDETCFKLQS